MAITERDRHAAAYFWGEMTRDTTLEVMVSITSRGDSGQYRQALLVVEQEIDELRDLNVIDGDIGLVQARDDQVMLLNVLQF
jgi:hypothetical protein